MINYSKFRRERRPSPNVKNSLRLHRCEYGDDLRRKYKNIDNYYPDTTDLIKKLSLIHKMKLDNFVVGLGAESLIKDIFLWHSQNFKKRIFLNIKPNYFMYSYFSRLFNYKEEIINLNPLHVCDLKVKNILKIISKKKVTFLVLVNPSSPVEKNWSRSELINIIKFSKKKKVIILIDEVYASMGSISVLDLIKKFDNLIILRSFSKAYGFPGLRVGYVVANSILIKKLESYRLAIELPSYVIKKSIYLLNNYKKILLKRVKNIIIARKYAHEQFRKRNIKSFNFFNNSVTFELKSEELKKYIGNNLLKKKVFINYNLGKNLNNFANITTTNLSNLKVFFKKFDKFFI